MFIISIFIVYILLTAQNSSYTLNTSKTNKNTLFLFCIIKIKIVNLDLLNQFNLLTHLESSLLIGLM